MPSERRLEDENPYSPPSLGSRPSEDSPPSELYWAWTLIVSGTLLLLGVPIVLLWFKEFGIAGMIMPVGGFTGSQLGWRTSKRLSGLLIGAVAGFSIGAVFGITSAFVF